MGTNEQTGGAGQAVVSLSPIDWKLCKRLVDLGVFSSMDNAEAFCSMPGMDRGRLLYALEGMDKAKRAGRAITAPWAYFRKLYNETPPSARATAMNAPGETPGQTDAPKGAAYVAMTFGPPPPPQSDEETARLEAGWQYVAVRGTGYYPGEAAALGLRLPPAPIPPDKIELAGQILEAMKAHVPPAGEVPGKRP